ncbi:hypothetical protein [Mesorhizobium sp.]|uniref:hypothetical protein n=1 Tax=Mesorhizobium sp. TaxID=1871066 RepID=UPI000FE830A0|nr:hypothetical protein [Mesorhizobium sp.]RWE37472.1 MAG: hypothetical protein EOS77_02515 [Mesorhizobium sp.]
MRRADTGEFVHRLPDEEVKRRLEIFEETGYNITETARRLGIKRASMQGMIRRLKARAAERNLDGSAPNPTPLPEGFIIKEHTRIYDDAGKLERQSVKTRKDLGEAFVKPDDHALKGLSVLTDGDDRVLLKWHKTDREIDRARLLADAVGQAMEKYKPSIPHILRPRLTYEEWLTLYILTDWHVGLFAYGKETGKQDWDLTIARQVLPETFRELVDLTPKSNYAIVLGLGDLVHADNSRNMTERSGNVLDVDTRYSKCLTATADMLIEAAEMVASKHAEVEIEIEPGNHDPNSTVALRLATFRHFRNTKRVQASLSPDPFFWKRFGVNLIGGTHGDNAKLVDMPMIMANSRKQDWSETVTRHMHSGHVHHDRAREYGGVKVFSHRAPVAQDAYHAANGYLSGRSMVAYHYHASRGARGHSEVELL